MSEEFQKIKEKVEFENALKQRNFEIDLFWKRSWFFGALILALIAAFYTLKKGDSNLFPPVTAAFLLTVITFLQCLMNRGSKYWQERWEYMTMNREAALNIELTRLKKYLNEHKGEWYYIDASILCKEENILTRSRRFSVSKLTFLVWDIIFVCTFLNWLNESCLIASTNIDWPFTIKLVVFYSILSIYIFLFWRNGKVYEPYKMDEFNGEDLKELNENYINNKIV